MIRAAAIVAFWVLSMPGWAQELALRDAFGGGRVSLLERADLRRYRDGRFEGLAYREVRGVLDAEDAPSGLRLEGTFYVFEETRRDTRLVARRVDATVPVRLTLLPSGETARHSPADTGYPTLRRFPALPAGSLEPGTGWQTMGVRVVEPFRDGVYTRVGIYVDYRYQGTQAREGRTLGVVRAQYAMRYKAGQDPYGDARIQGISGRHVVTIYYEPATGSPVHTSDQMEEDYTLADGKTLGFKGFILTWYTEVEPMDRVRLAEEVRQSLEVGGVEEVSVTAEAEAGVKLTVNSIHFVADQATVLPEEHRRLDALAEALGRIEGRTFLVVGHTARHGTAESQDTLSVDRAKAIVDHLVGRGLSADRFMYQGRGAREPVAPNDTEPNMARNRRVEIFILED
jgi:outer membrane protein OmpA-like peptidoglycan-associated protein